MTNIVVNDPYAPGGLRVWDDYQFRRKGFRGGGQLPLIPGVAPATPPVNVVLPVVSGIELSGSILSCTEGTWDGTIPIDYAYQWYRVEVLSAPVNVGLPTVSGIEVEDEILSCFRGTWMGTVPITYEYQWFRVGITIPPAEPGEPLVDDESEGLTADDSEELTT